MCRELLSSCRFLSFYDLCVLVCLEAELIFFGHKIGHLLGELYCVSAALAWTASLLIFLMVKTFTSTDSGLGARCSSLHADERTDSVFKQVLLFLTTSFLNCQCPLAASSRGSVQCTVGNIRLCSCFSCHKHREQPEPRALSHCLIWLGCTTSKKCLRCCFRINARKTVSTMAAIVSASVCHVGLQSSAEAFASSDRSVCSSGVCLLPLWPAFTPLR